MPDKADPAQQARSAREHARQARAMANELAGEDRARVLQFAEELEQMADRLEQEAAANAIPPPATTQPQQQVQQQQGTEATPDPAEPKPET